METPADRLRIALELHDVGVAMHRLTLQRRNPELSAAELDAKLEAWLLDRPGAPWGDAEGHRRPIDP